MSLTVRSLRNGLNLCCFLLIAGLVACSAPDAASSGEAVEQDLPDYEARLQELGISLSPPPTPVANYVLAVRAGDLVFLSGHGPARPDGTLVKGKLGSDLTIEEGREAARLTALALLSSLQAEIGTLNHVKRIVKVTGMVNSDPAFTEQPQVVNGCSDLLVEIFGEAGKHARAAVGMAALPSDIAVEIEMIVQVTE